MTDLARSRATWEEHELDIYPVSVDRPAQSRQLAEEWRLAFTFLCDSDGAVSRAYGRFRPSRPGGLAEPGLFLLSDDGRIIFRSLDEKARRAGAGEVRRFLERRRAEAGYRLEGQRRRWMRPSIRQYLRNKGLWPDPYRRLK